MSYFAGSFGYLLILYHGGSLATGSYSVSLQSANLLLNPPFALSLPIIFYLLVLIYEKNYSLKTTIHFILGVIAIVAFKFYGIVVAGVFSLIFFYEMVKSKQIPWKQIILRLLFFFCLFFLMVIFVYNPFRSPTSEPLFKFSPFAMVHATIEERDLLYLPNIVNARYYLYAQGVWGPRLLAIELFSTAIFILLHFGARILGLVYICFQFFRRKTTSHNYYIFFTIVATTLATILFIQRGEWWNTVQFSYYGIALSNIFLAIVVFKIMQKKTLLRYILAGSIIVLLLPQNYQIFTTFTTRNSIYIDDKELEALAYLDKQPYGVVFTAFQDVEKQYRFLPYKLTGYVSAFTDKPIFYGHEAQMSITGIDYRERKARVESLDCTIFDEVDYIYFVKTLKRDFLDACQPQVGTFSRIYENDLVEIYSKFSSDAGD
ncbi:hypothetical protein KC726_04940 [Candidatus Woesebacteria bacterium]|nr:hypothetical protein [Candidatus Woesebacteria bacterium]